VGEISGSIMAIFCVSDERGVNVKVSSILLGRALENGADPVLGSQPADGRMHSHEPGGGLKISVYERIRHCH